MASLKGTKRRIASVKNTQKITRAMKLVSSAKYARSLASLNNAKPYGGLYLEMAQFIVAQNQAQDHVLVAGNKAKNTLYLLLATDRGLCGGLNTNLFKLVESEIDKNKAQAIAWGKRAKSFCQRLNINLKESKTGALDRPNFTLAANLARQIIEAYKQNECGEVKIAYSSFKNALTQTPVLKTLLPLHVDSKHLSAANKPFLWEPSIEVAFEAFVKNYLASQIYQATLEAAVSEHAARMAAMDSATNNADEVIRRLTLEYNRARQAAITKELIEITSGAEAL